MKRLLLTYLCCVTIAFVLPLLIGIGHAPGAEGEADEAVQSLLPDKIAIFFDEQGKTEEIDFEDYIKGVLAAEMPALFEEEALKAQAVAARTYAFYKYKAFSDNPAAKAEHPDAPLCTAAAHCSAFYTPEQLRQKHGDKWMNEGYKKISRCVELTKGEILVYEDEPILAVFHSASAGGNTQSSGDVWGKQLPYLVSVKTQGEQQKADYFTNVVVSRADFAKKITDKFQNAAFGDDSMRWVGRQERTAGGYIKSIELGGISIDGAQVRAIFGLKSTLFDISIDDKNVTFSVWGNGHGVGLSQYGANYMAKSGQGYRQILESYYKGATLCRY